MEFVATPGAYTPSGNPVVFTLNVPEHTNADFRLQAEITLFSLVSDDHKILPVLNLYVQNDSKVSLDVS